MDEVYGVCPYCGFDAEAAVSYQSKQNDETLSPAEHAEEVEFYLYESHPDFCEGMRNSIKEADYTIDMINSHGVKWSGNITEKKDGYKKYSADYEYHYNMSSKYAGSDVLDTLRNSSDTTKAEAIDWLIDNGFLHSDEQYNAAYVLALGDAIGISDDDWDSETFEATDWNCNHPSFDILGSWDQYSVLYAQCNDCGRYGSLYTRGPVWDKKGHPTTKKTYNLLKNTPHSPEFWFQSGFRPSGAYESETFEAYNPEQPRDEGGRWISDEEMQSYITGAHFRRPSKHGSKITLRQLSEAVMETTHNHLDFDTAHELVNRMLSQHPAGDSQEARTALLLTLEETQMQLEYADEIGWDMDLEIMAGLLRSRGIEPPEEYAEAVINRLTFEDEWATEETLWGERDSLICDTSNCDEILSYDESFGWRGHDYCEECYDYWLMKDRQSLLTEDTDCLECGFSIHPEDVRQSLNEDGYCEHCLKNLSDRTNAAEETVGYDKPLGESLNWTPYEYRDSKNNKPNKPTPAKDFDMADTFGRSVLLMSETFESSNYKCVSCGLSFAQEDTRDIDGEIVCDDCVYEIYSMDEFDGETFSPNRKGNWETGDFLTLANISELIADAQHMGCLVTSYDSREVLDSSHLIDDKDWRNTIIEIYTDYKYIDASESKFNYDHKFVYDFDFNSEEKLWELVSLEQPYAISLAYPYHMQYIVQSTDPDEAAEMAYRGEGKRSDVGDLSKSPIFTWPSSVDWQPNPDDARPLFD